jgi:hypothetical protein
MAKKKDVEFVSQSKTNSGLLYGKKTGKTYIKEGPESYKIIRTPGKRPGPVKPKAKPAIPTKKVDNTKVTYKTQPKGALSGIAKLVLDPFSDYSKKTTVKTKMGR